MAISCKLTTMWLTLFCLSVSQLVYGADKSFRLPLTRDVSDAKTGDLTSKRLPSLYWSTLVNVGDSSNLKLAVDTGSTDILINPGKYKSSKNREPYPGKKTFTAGFEGVNRNGYGFVQCNGTIQLDTVSAGSFTVKEQALGSITTYKLSDTTPLPAPIPGQGVIGFAGTQDSQLDPQSPAWITNIYNQGDLDEFRFGLAFGTSGKGQIVLGTFDQSLADGPVFPIKQLDPNGTYLLPGDVYLNGKKVFTNQKFIMDVGTTNIQSPLQQASSIFKTLGWQTYETDDRNIDVKILSAYFPCDKPPVLGFGFPSATGQTTKIFNVSTPAWGFYNHGKNNCTSVLGGTNGISTAKEAVWLIGQAFFDGHYMDFNNGAKTIGIANLNDPTGASFT